MNASHYQCHLGFRRFRAGWPEYTVYMAGRKAKTVKPEIKEMSTGVQQALLKARLRSMRCNQNPDGKKTEKGDAGPQGLKYIKLLCLLIVLVCSVCMPRYMFVFFTCILLQLD